MARHANIIGAGIAGLATAAALRRAGWSVTVRERAAAPPGGGTALGMWPEAMAALDHLGVGDRVRRESTLAHGATILRPSGVLLGRVPASRGVHLVLRDDLLSTLLEAAGEDTVEWSRPWTPSAPLPAADLTVGADGIHSTVRSAHWGGWRERPLGTTAFRGTVDLPTDAVTETWGQGALFGITPAGPGRTNWFACLRDDLLRGADEDHLVTLRRYFSAWHPDVRRVLGRIEGPGIDRRELYDVSLPLPYVQGKVVLLGDAAHAMAPNLGRGACESLVDAVALARALEAEPETPAALRRYDRERRPRTRRIVRAARVLNAVATARRGSRLRNRAVGLLLPGR